ncbi:tRNA(Ile)-lysidine synthetase, partial [bacterium]
MLEKLRAHLERTGLIPGGVRVLVGYSGGADSTCMLHLLHRLGFDIVAAHLHHGQREEADREAALCEAFCTEIDVPFVSGRADVPRISREAGIGLEEAGRNARYEFFRQAAFRLECELIATAHT